MASNVSCAGAVQHVAHRAGVHVLEAAGHRGAAPRGAGRSGRMLGHGHRGRAAGQRAGQRGRQRDGAERAWPRDPARAAGGGSSSRRRWT